MNMKKQNIDELNKLLEQSMDSLLCGPTCQQLRVEQELEQKYINAQMNLETAPVVLEDTKRNYYVFKEGESYYNNLLEDELKEKANELTKLIKDNFNNEIKNVKVLNNYYESDLINSKNSEELYNSYLKDNESLEKIITNKYGDILTNNRKTYYSNDALERLKKWHRIYWYIYYILVVVLILGFLLAETNINKIAKIIITIILLVYPYIIDPIIKWIYKQIKKIYNNLPKNIYNNI